MKTFELSWPTGFNAPISKEVKTMQLMKKHVGVGAIKVYDTNVIYSRIIGLQASGREVDIDDVLKYELAPIPMAMFDSSGDMRVAKTKSTLKRQLQVETSNRITDQDNCLIIDGSAMLWVIPWPTHGKVQDYVDKAVTWTFRKVQESDVYLVFDRYMEYSIKDNTRNTRQKGASRQHRLTLTMLLPPQKVLLTVTQNKIQLIDLNVAALQKEKDQFKLCGQKLVVTGRDPIPVEINKGVVIRRCDLKTMQEEADGIMIQHMIAISEELDGAGIRVMCDDTDVFALLLHFYHLREMSCSLTMESLARDRKCVDIRATATKHKEIIPNLLAAHALSGCDTVAQCWGVGKGKLVKVLKAGHTLPSIGTVSASDAEVVQEATSFMAACYGENKSTTMTAVRRRVWKGKTGRANIVSAPKLQSLPPTDESFLLNAKRSHFQACIWRHADESSPPSLDPLEHGWMRDTVTKVLTPVMLPTRVPPAPDYILRMIKCSCGNCGSARCSCVSSALPCTVFCRCDGSNDCLNSRNAYVEVLDSDDDKEND